MAETTGIAWCDSTFNAWIGCTKVSPGCDHCYAEALDARHRWGGNTHWGTAVPRYRTSANLWKQPLAWNRKAEQSGKPWRVFTNSLADVFDNEVPQEWRTDLFRMIAKTPALSWLLLTKRIGNATKMLHTMMIDAPPLPNVWIGASVVNQEEAERDIPKLLATPASVRFLSYEPALGPIDFRTIYRGLDVDWIIIGGESRQGKYAARPFDTAWARSVVEQCRSASVACFIKQLGSTVISNLCGPVWSPRHEDSGLGYFNIFLKDRAGADPDEWPYDLRVREFPRMNPLPRKRGRKGL